MPAQADGDTKQVHDYEDGLEALCTTIVVTAHWKGPNGWRKTPARCAEHTLPSLMAPSRTQMRITFSTTMTSHVATEVGRRLKNVRLGFTRGRMFVGRAQMDRAELVL
ncbi:unnamed protein product [Heligmosomoides polygyrus]|uniref:Transposase n=1 Tax=Heligmosomoides polygyrus TaxID=6339 RepID=A0A183GTL7_HELPZ|nr:unnamed protein product [Heligmosomoides polygyrus]